MRVLGIILAFLIVCIAVVCFILLAEFLISYHDYKEMEETYEKDMKKESSNDGIE